MKKALIGLGALLGLLGCALLALFGHGYVSALRDAPALAAEADRLAGSGRSPEDLGAGRAQKLLMVEDPGFAGHDGIDLATPGSGLTTLTQSLGKRVGFTEFRPGWRKFRLMGYAWGLEARLSKQQILTLHLDRVHMGRDRQGRWMVGLFTASERIFGKPPAALPSRDFLTLVAVSIAPARLRLAAPSPELVERVNRIERLVQRRCMPADLRDVWLEGCAGPRRTA